MDKNKLTKKWNLCHQAVKPRITGKCMAVCLVILISNKVLNKQVTLPNGCPRKAADERIKIS